MADLYAYQPLLDRDRIRLLHILPGPGHAPLEGKLEQVRLTEGQFYETLSYTWGQDEAEESILIDSKRIAITPNCSNAVRNLRREDVVRVFWIDALCINQADKTEKAQQVSMMGDVYSRSQRTVVYLGAGDGTVHLLRNQLEIPPGALGLKPGMGDKIRQAKRNLVSRRWFRRKWIIQEVLLSREVVVQSGRHEFTWAELETLDQHHELEIVKLAKKYLHPSSLSSMQVNGQDWDPKAKAAWEDMFEQGEVIAMDTQLRLANQANLPRYSKYRSPQTGFLMPPQLFDVLCMTSDFECKEERDRLYAVLSLFARKMDLILDYTCDDAEVYRSLTKELLSLGDTRMFWLEDRTSWRPNWSTALSTLAAFVKEKRGTAIGRLIKEVHQEKRAGLISELSGSVWKTQGLCLGRVTSVAAQPFEHHVPAADGMYRGPADHSLPQWESILLSLGLGGPAAYESGQHILAHIHHRNRTLSWFRDWTHDLLGRSSNSLAPREPEDPRTLKRAMSSHHGHLSFASGMRMFVCDRQILGIAPEQVLQGDFLYFLFGYTCPFLLLRPKDARWELVCLGWIGPLKLFPCCFNGGSSKFFGKEQWETLEIV